MTRKFGIIYQSQIVFLLSILPFFMPRLWQYNTLSVNIQKAWLAVSVIYSINLAIKLYRYPKNRSYIFLFIFLYESWTQLACFINHQFSVYFFLTELSYLALFIIIDYHIKRNLIKSLSTISGLCLTLISVNLLSILFAQTSYMDASGNSVYFWNTRNHLSSLFMLGMVTSNLLSHVRKRKQYGASLRWWLTIILVFISIILTVSSTTIVGISVFVLLLILARRWKFIYHPVVLMIVAFVAHLAIVVFRIQNVVSYLVVQILGKDMTFTGRTDIWDAGLLSIAQHFWTGISQSNTIAVWFSDSGVSAHNQLLEIGMESGIIGLVLFIILLLSLALTIEKNKKKKADLIVFSSILSYVVMMIAETVSPYYPWFIIFGLVSNIDLINEVYLDKNHCFRVRSKKIYVKKW